MADPPRVAVLGAGSVGCFIGGVWAAAGVPVTFIGRERLANDVRAYGLTVTDYSGWQAKLAPASVDFRCDAEGLAGAEIIVLAVKSGDTEAAADEIARHATDGATVISFQNGVSNVEALQARLSDRFPVTRGMVSYNVAYLGGGRLHKGVAGDLYAERAPVVEALAQAAGEGPAALRPSENMLGLAWGKLLINLNNAVNALSGLTLREELKRRDYRRVFAAAMREGLELLGRAEIRPQAAGPVPLERLPKIIDTPNWLFNTVVLRRWKIDAKARSSMADDLAAGRKTEIDYLNGELVRLAERLQLAAPVNRAIVDLVHQAEAGASPLPPKALRKAVLGR